MYSYTKSSFAVLRARGHAHRERRQRAARPSAGAPPTPTGVEPPDHLVRCSRRLQVPTRNASGASSMPRPLLARCHTYRRRRVDRHRSRALARCALPHCVPLPAVRRTVGGVGSRLPHRPTRASPRSARYPRTPRHRTPSAPTPPRRAVPTSRPKRHCVRQGTLRSSEPSGASFGCTLTSLHRKIVSGLHAHGMSVTRSFIGTRWRGKRTLDLSGCAPGVARQRPRACARGVALLENLMLPATESAPASWRTPA